MVTGYFGRRIGIVVLLFTAVLIVLPVSDAKGCEWRCYMSVDYTLCGAGRWLSECEVVAQCGPGCQFDNAHCCQYYCAGARCYRA